MSVVLPDGLYQLVRFVHPEARDGHGLPVPAAAEAPTPLLPGAAQQQSDGMWMLRLDPSTWPVRAGDVVQRPADGAMWTVNGEPRVNRVPGTAVVDFVRVTALQMPTDPDRGQPSGVQ